MVLLEISPDTRKEIARFLNLLPLARMDFRGQFLEHVSSSDALTVLDATGAIASRCIAL